VRTDRERILDALDAAALIATAVDLGRDRFGDDLFVQGAVIRWIQMIGEALTHVSPEFRAAHPAVPWRGAAAMRNRTVHGYFDIDLDIVWSAAEVDIPSLVPMLRETLEEA
jgi:uncharacterized protein with HEPN domain